MKNEWSDRIAPDLAAFDALARQSYDALPKSFRVMCGDIVIHIADFASDDILDSFGIEDPFELTGLYEGVDLTGRSIDDLGSAAAHIHLYRQPILAEWIDNGEETLGRLVRHVLFHEIGHHFGLSDEAMHAIEDD